MTPVPLCKEKASEARTARVPSADTVTARTHAAAFLFQADFDFFDLFLLPERPLRTFSIDFWAKMW